jgi:hypothetical protein
VTDPPPSFGATREGLRALACYAISPARKARTGRIGLRPIGEGFGTPPFDDGTRVVVRGDRLSVEPGRDIAITTVRAAADFLGVTLSPDPGVGRDLPPLTPDVDLAVDAHASRWLGAWYDFGARRLERLTETLPRGTVSEAQLWPEHFDLAVVVELEGQRVNVGFSPGDTTVSEPYVYVGPHDRSGLAGEYWNASFGAVMRQSQLRGVADADGRVDGFVDEGLRLVDARADAGA